jgi:hypothetical protein
LVTYRQRNGDRSVRPIIFAFLAFAAASTAARAADAKDPVAMVRALRAESNAAIAAHDAVRLRPLLDDAYHGIQGTSGELDSGGEATAQSYANEEFKDSTFVTYRRSPETVKIARSGKRIAESGRWEGVWRKHDGVMRKSGVYLAMWIPVGDSWRLKSESFVTLACRGSADCQKAG